MSGVLHPVGPEPVRTYWLRRGVLLAVLAALIGLVATVTTSIGHGPQAAEPTLTVTGSPTPQPTGTATESPAAARTSAPSSAGPSSSSSSSGSSGSSGRVVLPTAPPAPKTCDPAELRPTLMGPRSLKAGAAASFAVSLINGSGATCKVLVSAKTFELKIYSGTDRIWSTADCASSVRTADTTLAAEKALAWRQPWNGGRSASGCKTAATKPRPGVYWATASFSGAKPVQLRMIIR